ncbi:Leucine-rich repeat serine/threonine-protein kinase 2 [Phytophthora pseudosyringae]|uniref:Leucine-rich repeat serine/threonine-protein kinase 2 n=1 Tax=Phytophthora pseudosyringae TaxID=221518 RepID=A0A8T1VZW2_9STRA|nr:Leucine-rich repeat serine/threonine-protein kinase 2 [Phytophthora pseudosyringae]
MMKVKLRSEEDEAAFLNEVELWHKLYHPHVSPKDAVDNEELEPELEKKCNIWIGAIRWKAPEVLRGEKATFASDIYSFGMCIIEAVSGKYPWGMTLDSVVKYFVVRKKCIPERPKNCNEDAYALVERMCRYDPRERLGLNGVVEGLKALRVSS